MVARHERSQPLVAALEDWMRAERARPSRSSPVAKALDYMLTRWAGFLAFLEDGRICLTNNAAERALRGIALGRKSWLFAGSDRGGEARSSSRILACNGRSHQAPRPVQSARVERSRSIPWRA